MSWIADAPSYADVDHPDALNPARGMVLGALLALPTYALIGLAVWRLFL